MSMLLEYVTFLVFLYLFFEQITQTKCVSSLNTILNFVCNQMPAFIVKNNSKNYWVIQKTWYLQE
jgi:hypothetical protein